MKALSWFFVFLFLFLFIFFNSNTLERQVFTEKRGDDEYFVTKTSIHWERFSNYLRNIPRKIVNSLYSLKSKYVLLFLSILMYCVRLQFPNKQTDVNDPMPIISEHGFEAVILSTYSSGLFFIALSKKITPGSPLLYVESIIKLYKSFSKVLS